MTRHSMRIAICMLTLLSFGLWSESSFAQSKKPSKTPPFLIFSIASFERLLEDADYMFEAAGRPELSEMIGGALANVGDLKGLNRDSSVGLLLFLEGLVPEPVGFVPVKDIDELMKTITIGPVTPNKKEDGLWEIVGPNRTLFAKIVGDYAFVGMSEAALNRDFSDPAQFTRRLSASYDIAVSLNVRAIPKSSRDLMLDFLRARNEADVQQRDNEPDAAFRVRKAASVSNMESLEMFIKQAEETIIGLNVSAEDKTAFAELIITADPKSEYAKLLNDLGAARSLFTSLLKGTPAMTGSASVKLDKPARSFLKELLTVAQERVIKDLVKPASDGEEKNSPIGELFQSLQTSVTEGKLDFIVQFVGDPPGPFTLIGGVKVAEAERFGTGLLEIFDRLKGRDDLESVEIKVAEHKGVVLHRLQGKKIPDNANLIFGKDHGVYVGAGNGVLWFAIGAEDALPTLKDAITTVTDTPLDDNPVTPAQFVLHLSSWLGIIEQSDGGNPVVELMRESFSQGGGTIRAEIRPIADGMQSRLSFDEGYVRLVGKAIGRRIDSRR